MISSRSSRRRRRTLGHWLKDRTVVVGLSGGIACYKGAELVRRLRERGAVVRVMMTAGATQFITPLTLQTLSGHAVATSTFDLTQESEIGHIKLAEAADVVVIAPATANLIGKMAAGIADNLVTTVLLATRAPVLVAPAMNVHMYEHPAVCENLKRLQARGVRIVGPGSGSLACGYEGRGRLAEPPVIVAEVERVLARQDLAGERVVVSAGPTREAIDPVRFLSNRSTGKMGCALAVAAWLRGADVALVIGPSAEPWPHGVRVVPVTTAAEMRAAVLHEARGVSLVCMAAAVADYRPVRAAEQKLKKSEARIELCCERTADILNELAQRRGKRMLVGFAAETEDLLANAERKLREKKLDLIVVNDVSRTDIGFAADRNEVVLVDRTGREDVPLGSKGEVADRILDRVCRLRGVQAAKGRARRRPRPQRGKARE